MVDICNKHIGNANMREFLDEWKNIHATIEHSLTKPFKTSIEVIPHDLPRELAEKRLVIEKYESQKELLSLKDELIYKLVHEKNKNHQGQIDTMRETSTKEFEEWALLTDEYGKELSN